MRSANRWRVIASGSALLFGGAAVAYAQADGTSGSVVSLTLSSLSSAITGLQGQVSALQGADRVNRATIAPSGAVVSAGSAWIARVEHPSLGNYVLRFAPGAFATPPSCVATGLASVENAPHVAPYLSCFPATRTSLSCLAKVEIQSVDTDLAVICVGQ
jgi:hypothetical protein